MINTVPIITHLVEYARGKSVLVIKKTKKKKLIDTSCMNQITFAETFVD